LGIILINNFFRNISPQLLSAILNHNSFSSMNSQFSGEQAGQDGEVFFGFLMFF